MTEMKIAVVGSRTYDNREHLFTVLDFVRKTYGDFILVSGGANGADSLSEEWAKENNLKTIIHYPEWTLYGRGAGPIRNQKIVDDADILIAFWDGKSKGTKNSIYYADKKGIPVMDGVGDGSILFR